MESLNFQREGVIEAKDKLNEYKNLVNKLFNKLEKK